MIGPGVHVVSGLAFPHRVRLSNTAAPYDGLVVEASADPLAFPGAFLRYELGPRFRQRAEVEFGDSH